MADLTEQAALQKLSRIRDYLNSQIDHREYEYARGYMDARTKCDEIDAEWRPVLYGIRRILPRAIR